MPLSMQPYQMVLIAPREDYFGASDAAQKRALIISGSLAAVAVLLSCIMAYLSSLPLKKMSESMKKFTKFDFSSLENGTLESKSFVTELNTVETSFLTMVKPEWVYYYLDYDVCKRFLKGVASSELTDLDEAAFVEILDRELEKVASFRTMKGDELSRRVAKAERQVAALFTSHPSIAQLISSPVLGATPEETLLASVRAQVSHLLEEVADLSKYTRLNYTGFLKILKKHDRYTRFQLKPTFLLRLRARPFYEMSVEHLVVRLSRIFNNVRMRGIGGSGTDHKEAIPDKFIRKSRKYWVHYDKVDDLRNEILKKIPILIVKEKKSTGVEDIPNPAVSTTYFDNDSMDLFHGRAERKPGSQLIRLRWYGGMDSQDIFIERKVLKVKEFSAAAETEVDLDDDGSDKSQKKRNIEDESTEKTRFTVKEEFVNAYLAGNYQMDKSIQKQNEKLVLESILASPAFSPSTSVSMSYASKSPHVFGSSFSLDRGIGAATSSPTLVATTSRTAVPSKSRLQDLARLSEEIREVVKNKKLRPVLRTFYNRTAFQVPGDLRVRISLDTELTFIREDGPTRSGNNWRRADCGATWPFDYLPKEDVESFPYAVLEVKFQLDGGGEPEWVKKLVNDPLIREVPMFSKYLYGAAELLENKVTIFPEWLSLLGKDVNAVTGSRITPSDILDANRSSLHSLSRRSSTMLPGQMLETRRPIEINIVPLGTAAVVGFQAIDVTKRIVLPVRIEPKDVFDLAAMYEPIFPFLN
ncbi:vacuolar transporter chaperone [Entophlyctis luteolus]|nr:vacuolar transporter chaperone [Entophlyctis luteolus]